MKSTVHGIAVYTNFFGEHTTSFWSAAIFAAVLTDLGRVDLFASATEPVCRNAVTRLLMDFSVGAILTPHALQNSPVHTTPNRIRKCSSTISALC